MQTETPTQRQLLDWGDTMDALVVLGLGVLIFGGAQLIVGLIYFTIMDIVDRIRMRRYNLAILAAIQHRWNNGNL